MPNQSAYENKQRPADTSDELITKNQLAKKLKVSTRTIDIWVQKKYIPKIKVASSARFDWGDVVSQIKGQETAK